MRIDVEVRGGLWPRAQRLLSANSVQLVLHVLSGASAGADMTLAIVQRGHERSRDYRACTSVQVSSLMNHGRTTYA
jgi:hypothetical protein